MTGYTLSNKFSLEKFHQVNQLSTPDALCSVTLCGSVLFSLIFVWVLQVLQQCSANVPPVIKKLRDIPTSQNLLAMI